MDNKMIVWKLAKSILASCDSRADLNAVIRALENTKTRHQVINMLVTIGHPLERRQFQIPKTVPKLGNEIDALEAAMYNLFRRRLNMTNQEVESWLTSRFKVSKRIGKSSLYQYIRTVLEPNPSAIGRAILSEAARDFGSSLGSDGDLKAFWEGLDARRNGDSNAIIQRTIDRFPSEPKELGNIRQ